MNSPIMPLHHYTDLHEIASSFNIPSKMEVAGVKIFGDSLSDPGGKNGMYEKKLLGCIPLSLFLNKSPHEQFTNGYGWDYAFEEALEFARESNNRNPYLAPVHGFFKFVNRAQGGATAYNYREKILNLFKYPKGFFLSFVLTNIQKQAKDIKKDEDNKLNLDDLCIIFAGANDLVTVGYCNKDGAERAIQGIEKTIETLTTSQQKDGSNCTKNILVFTLPDFSKTPRLSEGTEKQRKKAHEADHFFNKELKKLAKNYQYHDFTLCDIYQVDKKEARDLNGIKNKGIVITGSGNTRKVYFVDKGQYIFREGKEISIDINLTKAEKELLGEEKGKISWENINELEGLIHKLCSKAKLNADVRIFDAAKVFEEIYDNPEVYGFTSGCAIYYLNKNQDKECISKHITLGNAIIIREVNQEYNKNNNLPAEVCCYYVKDGKLIEHGEGSMELPNITKFSLSEESKNELTKKLKEHPLKDGICQLTGMEDEHTPGMIDILRSAIQAHAEQFKEKIQLINIFASILVAMKKKFPNKQVMFWDNLHPSVIVHFILFLIFKLFFKNNYSIKQARAWEDDMGISDNFTSKAELPSMPEEAPDKKLRGSVLS